MEGGGIQMEISWNFKIVFFLESGEGRRGEFQWSIIGEKNRGGLFIWRISSKLYGGSIISEEVILFLNYDWFFEDFKYDCLNSI